MSKKEVQKMRELSQSEKSAIQKVKKLGAAKQKDIFRFVEGIDETEGHTELAMDDRLSTIDSHDEYRSRIFEASGCVNQLVGMQSIIKAGEALTPSKASPKEIAKVANMTAQAVAEMEPRDEVEGQLISQLVVLHEQAMTWLGRALRVDRADFANTYLNGASKLLTRHHETLSSLLKYRRGGEQRVHVEHVHVHNGGKAIVGNVESGGGLNQKVGEGPHAKV